jgi:3-deoxy-D-manno-octulosonate 8-phosphate phosphatase (KDO 8-P phosphatase)
LLFCTIFSVLVEVAYFVIPFVFMNPLEAFEQIDTFIFDVDGVLTDGAVLITEAGELLRTMNVKDGYAMRQAVLAGYRLVIITGGKSKGVAERLKLLGIQHVFINAHDKLTVFDQWVAENNIELDTILYMGDDLPDFPVMHKVGLPTCPKDAVPEILSVARYVSPYGGGQGCVRDVIEKVMRLQGNWPPKELGMTD